MEEPDEGAKSKATVRVRKRKTAGSPPRGRERASGSSPRHGSAGSSGAKSAAAPALVRTATFVTAWKRNAGSSGAKSAAAPAMIRTATVVRLFKTLPHVQARSENHPDYRGKRKKVEDDRVAWSVPWDDYDLACPEFTAKAVLNNGRQLETGAKWADPPNVQVGAVFSPSPSPSPGPSPDPSPGPGPKPWP